MKKTFELSKEYMTSIAVIGITGRFPGARNIEQFWKNLCAGKEGISFFSEQELADLGVDIGLLRSDRYVKARGILEDADLFDAQFFGFTPREAEIIDPQHRVFLECAWEVLENAGYTADYQGTIGVYAGCSMNTYLKNLYLNPEVLNSADFIQIMTGNDKDFLPTRVSYKLNLKGPSFAVQSACSSSLIAVHAGCRSLLTHECDMVMAGGVSISLPLKGGYLYHEGGVSSPDGHVRAFDANANGTVFCNGIGVVMLKRLSDAIKDGDTIHAIIRGSAVNNDGSNKVGYTAPSVEGQDKVIRSALAVAGVSSDTITLIEAHGTGTPLGDPTEIAALSKAFRTGKTRTTKCAIGSVKTNIGHLDVASGVAGLIKTVLALKHKLLPPSLNFETPNPEAHFENTPFYVNTQLQEWETNGFPRRAGLSSYGFGGTNVHMVLEETPALARRSCGRECHLLVLSAKSPAALRSATANLAEYLRSHADLPPADVAHTLQVGRRAFPFKRALACSDLAEAAGMLEAMGQGPVPVPSNEVQDRPIVFMFPGQAAQYPGMGAGLYRSNKVFRESIDQCAEILHGPLGLDIRSILYPDRPATEADVRQLSQTNFTQPALFMTEYALAKVWMSWGITPQAMIGHSIGEYVAACLAGVFSQKDALAIVAKRGQLMQKVKPGAMLAVGVPEKEIHQFIGKGISIAAINAPTACVVSGEAEQIAAVEVELRERKIFHQRLTTSHAFHSAMMDPILDEFRAELNTIKFHKPTIPYMSNLTGTWVTAETATSPDKWVQHLRGTVRFSEGITQLLSANHAFIEVGPGGSLSSLVKQCSFEKASPVVVASFRRSKDSESEEKNLLESLGRLWTSGIAVDWSAQYEKGEVQRIPLPTYPFERQRYMVEPSPSFAPDGMRPKKHADIGDWFYASSWKQVPAIGTAKEQASQQRIWTVFTTEGKTSSAFIRKLNESGSQVIVARGAAGANFAKTGPQEFILDPTQPEHYQKLISAAGKSEMQNFVHFWSLTADQQNGGVSPKETFLSLLLLAQALGEKNVTSQKNLWVITDRLARMAPADAVDPEKAMLVGACQSIPQEYPDFACELLDIGVTDANTAEILALHCRKSAESSFTAYRMGSYWRQCFEPVRLPYANSPRLKDQGVYLLTGGLGGIGLVLAEHLASTRKARLVLVSRSAAPAKAEWESLMAVETTPAVVRNQINVLRKLEELGAEVLVTNADVSNESQMRAVAREVMERFGTVNGIIHAAGIAGGGIIQFKTAAEIESVLAAKVQGTLIIEKVFKDFDLDFFVACSSIAGARGAFGQADYAAANAFMDSFCLQNQFKPATATFSIGWDTWRDVGMAQNASLSADLEHVRANRLSVAIANEEGAEVFERVLGLEQARSHVVVSTIDFSFVLSQPKQKEKAAQPSADSGRTLHDRPPLTAIFVAPRNETERRIAEVWQSVLGIKDLGINDDFWELGGHSLLATQVVSRLREAFSVDLPMRTLFDSPTIELIAPQITQLQAQSVDGVTLDQMVEELKQLSPEEVKALLESERLAATGAGN